MKPFKTRPAAILLAIFLVVITLVSSTTTTKAQTSSPEEPVYIYFFWGDGCSHCAKAKPFLENLASKYDNVYLKTYEVYYDTTNQQLYYKITQKYGINQMAVPGIFVGANYYIGYSDQIALEIEYAVSQCVLNGCEDAGAGIEGLETTKTPTPAIATETTETGDCSEDAEVCEIDFNNLTLSPTATATPTPVEQSPATATADTEQLSIPLFGNVELSNKSVALSTSLIAFVDGVNPCSLWVLSVLLALTLHTGSRKKIFIIGIVFLTVTAGIYALFIAGLFNILKITRFLGWVQILTGLLTLFFAIVNIKDYFWFKEGISLTIAEDKKSGIYKHMRNVVDAGQSFWGMVGATIVLAAGVSLVEFSCTAGFPVVWTNIIVSQNVTGIAFVMLLLLYMVIYQLDEMVIFFTSVVTLKSSRMEENHGRLLKLIGGMLMLTLSIVMLFNPDLMSDLTNSLLIFLLAFLATLLVLLVHRVILPKFGITFGSDSSNNAKPSGPSK